MLVQFAEGKSQLRRRGVRPLTTPRSPRTLPQLPLAIDLGNAPKEWLGFVRDLA